MLFRWKPNFIGPVVYGRAHREILTPGLVVRRRLGTGHPFMNQDPATLAIPSGKCNET